MTKLQLREGGIYRRRDGKVVGPASKREDSAWPWAACDVLYTNEGHYDYTGDKHPLDLIEEVYVNSMTNEEVVRRFNELVKAGQVQEHKFMGLGKYWDRVGTEEV